MRKLYREKLKDIIIDHVYHYCFNEVIQKIEGDNIILKVDVDSNINEDPVLKSALNEILKSTGRKELKYETRNTLYCNIIEGVEVQKSFMDRLLSQGFKKSNILNTRIENAIVELIHKSYLARNQPLDKEVTLTQKGLNHYNSGLSFEKQYIEGRNGRIALIISIISITIAALAFLLTLKNKNP
jgi:hypothetical protein